MPNITYPAFFPFETGDLVAPTRVDNLFFDDTSAFQDSLAIVNGGLDAANISADWPITAEYTQRGSHVDMFTAARTANMDWRWSWAGVFESDFPFVFDDKTPYKPIPGGCSEFYLRADSVVVLLWQCFWMNDCSNASDPDAVFRTSDVFLLIDGTFEQAQWRATNIAATTIDLPRGYEKARCWAGHVTVELAEGWHSVALCHVADRRIRMTRHWASSMKGVVFNHPGGSG